MRRRKQQDESINEELTRRTRRDAQKYQTQRDALAESTLLGLDDGTEDAALQEELNFDKFDFLIEEEMAEQTRLDELRSRSAPIHDELKRFRERDVGNRIWKNR